MCGEVTLWASWPLLAMPLGYFSSGKALLVPDASFLRVHFEIWGLLLHVPMRLFQNKDSCCLCGSGGWA